MTEKITLTRFCSRAEYDKYMRGETLTSRTDHYKGGRGGSTSKGFCFSPDEPRTAWRYLKGIVDCDVCMVLEFDKARLTESRGVYPDYSSGELKPGCRAVLTEYCTTSYSKNTARLVKALKPREFATDDEIIALGYLRAFKQNLKAMNV